MEKKRTQLVDHNRVFTNVMVWPALIILLLTSLLPIIYVLITSMTDMTLITMNRGGTQWVGFKNYIDAIQDKDFMHSIWVTVKFTLLAVVSETVFGTLLALFLHGSGKPSKLLRTLFLFPMLCPPITITLIWQTMFSNSYGILNQILGVFGVAPVNWLQDINTAFYAVLWVDIWQYAPFVFLLVYVALCQMPQELHEAAALDGANSFQRLRHVTLPYLAKPMTVVILLRLIDTFRLFDKVNVLTKGGPYNSTRTITMYIYQRGYNDLDIGVTSATSILMTLLILLIAFPYIRSSFKQMVQRR
ncbi:MAG TPA: sugar ABC transporter permease [Clostridiaceae bacterium]|nr:sugar ABC transporter permease [Clostridiaceae bacterium]